MLFLHHAGTPSAIPPPGGGLRARATSRDVAAVRSVRSVRGGGGGAVMVGSPYYDSPPPRQGDWNLPKNPRAPAAAGGGAE